MKMNRKNKVDLKNKRHMGASLILQFLLILALFGMMSATLQAAPFLEGTGSDNTITLSSGQITVFDRSDSPSVDTWAPDLLDETLNHTLGYLGDGYKAGTPDYSDDLVNYNYDKPVYYLGTFSGNDGLNSNENNLDLEELIQYFLGSDYNIVAYGKYDYNESDGMGTLSYDDENELDELSFDLFDLEEEETYDDSGNLIKTEVTSGKWKITDSSGIYEPGEKINFYSIKGANEFALYYVNPQQSAGTWTNQHLLNPSENNNPAMSHFSVMRTFETEDPNVPPGAVPEPATMLLFGFSLMGLAGMARRRNSKF